MAYSPAWWSSRAREISAEPRQKFASFTNDEVRNRILKVYAKFVSDVEPDRLSDWLVQENVITIDQKQRIRYNNPIASDRCRAILDHLFSIQHARAFLVVRQALVKENHYLLEEIDNQKPLHEIRVQPEEQSVLHARIQELEKDLVMYRSVNAQLHENEDELKQLVHQLKSELRLERDDSKREKTSQQIVLAEQFNENSLLRKEVGDQRRDKESLRSANEQLRIDINNEIRGNEAHKMTIKTLKDSVEKLEQELSRVKQDKLRYVSDPVLIQTIRTEAAETEKKPIFGLTILDNELFVVSEESSDVEVFDSIKLSFRRRWNLKELIYPFDLGSCDKNKCLYIMDHRNHGQSSAILRVDAKGKLIKKWSTGGIRGRLSVTAEANVILADFNRNKLNEYSPEGRLILEINISSVRYLRHAIKLTNDLFVVCHGSYNAVDAGDSDLQRVCIVDADGKLLKSFGGDRGSTIGQLNNPGYLFVDGNGFIMVADRRNSRVILLNSDLKFKREIQSKEKHGLLEPSSIVLDESNGRLFVVNCERDPKTAALLDARILIFDFF